MLKNYIGCKIVKVEKMTYRECLNKYPEKTVIPTKLNLDDLCYAVHYSDNYISVNPVDKFKGAYRLILNDEMGVILND